MLAEELDDPPEAEAEELLAAVGASPQPAANSRPEATASAAILRSTLVLKVVMMDSSLLVVPTIANPYGARVAESAIFAPGCYRNFL